MRQRTSSSSIVKLFVVGHSCLKYFCGLYILMLRGGFFPRVCVNYAGFRFITLVVGECCHVLGGLCTQKLGSCTVEFVWVYTLTVGVLTVYWMFLWRYCVITFVFELYWLLAWCNALTTLSNQHFLLYKWYCTRVEVEKTGVCDGLNVNSWYLFIQNLT